MPDTPHARILIVDDEPINLEELQSHVRRRLSKAGIDEARGAVSSADKGSE